MDLKDISVWLTPGQLLARVATIYARKSSITKRKLFSSATYCTELAHIPHFSSLEVTKFTQVVSTTVEWCLNMRVIHVVVSEHSFLIFYVNRVLCMLE